MCRVFLSFRLAWGGLSAKFSSFPSIHRARNSSTMRRKSCNLITSGHSMIDSEGHEKLFPRSAVASMIDFIFGAITFRFIEGAIIGSLKSSDAHSPREEKFAIR